MIRTAKSLVKVVANEIVSCTRDLYEGFTKSHAALFGLLGVIALMFYLLSP